MKLPCCVLTAGRRNTQSGAAVLEEEPLPRFVIGRVALADAGAESRAGPCTRHKMNKF